MTEAADDLDLAQGGAFSDVPVEITISVGRARPRIRELLAFSKGQILPLETSIDDPVELYVGERMIGRGELEEIEEGSGRIGVRIVELVAPPADAGG